MTPLAPLVTNFFGIILRLRRASASILSQATATHSSSCANMSAIDSARPHRRLLSRISMHA